MKGIKLIFAIILGISGTSGVYADTDADVARAATRRTATTTTTSTRQKKSTPTATIGTRAKALTSASADTQSRNAATLSPRDSTVVSRTATTPTGGGARTGTISTRGTSGIATRSVVQRANTADGASRTSAARTAAPITITPRNRTQSSVSRAATPIAARTAATVPSRRTSSKDATRISRAAVTADDIKARDYTTCRTVYYDCMDEFCANKDALLKRCACSARATEFDGIKQQLAQIEEQLLDFNQRLLTVNMDAEDANALFTATEGELAFNQEDKSRSKEMLDEISKKINTTFENTKLDQNLGAISMSLNVDAAFDTVDSLMGASTATKSGISLYNAALPVCREMAIEVCTQDDLEIVESAYQVAIEQDCNTVKSSYEAQQDQARQRIREGGALLDMSRLDIYQTRNKDDLLTCKKKMLEMLTDSAVCGDGLGKCLDTTGQYIDPSTGQAFLTTNLANLGNLIARPDQNQTWSSVPSNQNFVKYLDSKKVFLTPAMENCQDISDYVWQEFMQDALSQIKLAQEEKLEEMRQSCTTLTTQCITDTMKSLSDFDARALSTFGVEADFTVNQMCSSIKNACTALLNATGGGQDSWAGGMTQIAALKTYETIMKTCREVGRSCIIQSCKSISGNFGLCTDIYTSINRKNILRRSACWNEVYNCVASAGTDSIMEITELLADSGELKDGNFYTLLYKSNQPYTIITPSTKAEGNGANDIFDLCSGECSSVTELDKMTPDCKICRLTERLWGNCEQDITYSLDKPNTHNQIKIPINNQETLLSWFAKNTGTENENNSCADTSCPSGQKLVETDNGGFVCTKSENIIFEKLYCPEKNQFEITDADKTTFKNCCYSGVYDDAEDNKPNCCANGNPIEIKINDNTETKLCAPQGIKNATIVSSSTPESTPKSTPKSTNYLVCLGTLANEDVEPGYPNGRTLRCNGVYMYVTTTTDTNNDTIISKNHKYNSMNYDIQSQNQQMQITVNTSAETTVTKIDSDWLYESYTVKY